MRRLCTISLCLSMLCGMGCAGQQTPVGTFETIREGDLLLRRGRSAKSRAVLEADSTGLYSHIGVAVLMDSGMMVVHAVPGEAGKGLPDVVKLERPESFFSARRATKGAVFRLADTTDAGWQAASGAARYALRKYLDGMEFDNDYDLEDTTRMYCTELVWHAYLISGIDITDGRRSILKTIPRYSGSYIFPSDICEGTQMRQIEVFTTP